jgi:hypothetical protein
MRNSLQEATDQFFINRLTSTSIRVDLTPFPCVHAKRLRKNPEFAIAHGALRFIFPFRPKALPLINLRRGCERKANEEASRGTAAPTLTGSRYKRAIRVKTTQNLSRTSTLCISVTPGG